MKSFSGEQISMFKKSLNAARRRSLKRGITFSITLEDIFDIFTTQNGKCYYSDIEMNIVKDSDQLHDPAKMTLDCRNPKKGYIKDNVVMCLYCVNSFKQKMTEKEMKEICRKIITNDKPKN